ncbi:HDIG domain protein [Candidatus Syntrophocurvum alkaliphilum]|uniref:HDIG domain protein n=1 Tax=Candidatus Syntrophocurvum alkaliphilum TaxID=2293317 RepID=A0A6I6DHU5_9FIRM|nr:HD domain-containing protein [Candidatus Syntrophocurvum alkaliphilum]QGU00349.1 HDIG domain protein [Candidatus Syntrophocurvum alkaliphilum]
MQREQALVLLKENLKNENLISHSLAVEAIMRGLAINLNEDEQKWGLAGLLHDIDYDSTYDDPKRHSLIGSKILEENGLPADIVYAVKVHNEAHGLERKSNMDKALYAADPASGFIIAAALIRPDKSLNKVVLKSLKKRFKEKAFAKGANRNQMSSCTELGMELEEFLQISLESLKEIASDLGLE